MNLQTYAKHLEPKKLSGEELAYLRACANHFIKTGDLQKVQVGTTMNMLLDHIDYITLEAMKK